MSKKPQNINQLSDLRAVFGLKEENNIENQDAENLNPNYNLSALKIRVHLDRQKGNRIATVLKGLELNEAELDQLSRELKKLCGGGGNHKNQSIIIQGNHRDKIIDWLIQNGAKDVKPAGS
jgi:translation initiation factor 1